MNIDYLFSVAPMMGYTTHHARHFYSLLSKKSLLFTEMIASQALIRNKKNVLLKKNSIKNPIILQVGGNNESELRECSVLAKEMNYEGINLNLGCPSKKVQKGRFGACLMKEQNHVNNLIKSMTSETDLEFSIKCRTGVDDQNSYEFLKNFVGKATESGCKVFFIHARKAILKGLTPHQNRNIPKLEYEKIYKLKEDFPENKIILNGGIENLNDFDNIIKNLDGIMVGRLIQKNPFTLIDVDKKIFKTNETKINKVNIVKNYFDYIKNYKGEKSAYSLISPLLAMYFGIPNSKKWKQKINELIKYKNFENLEKICINSFL